MLASSSLSESKVFETETSDFLVDEEAANDNIIDLTAEDEDEDEDEDKTVCGDCECGECKCEECEDLEERIEDIRLVTNHITEELRKNDEYFSTFYVSEALKELSLIIGANRPNGFQPPFRVVLRSKTTFSRKEFFSSRFFSVREIVQFLFTFRERYTLSPLCERFVLHLELKFQERLQLAICRFEGKKVDDCCVCFESTSRQTECKHFLCFVCWSQLRQLVCPLCKRDIDCQL